ncbi:MAG: hypothetical protein ACREBS_11245 [Nitrososphaerales archaeon]
MQSPDRKTWVYLLAGAVYVFSVWEHIPYGGGHIYSDIISVFQNRFCPLGPCTTAIPYVHVFVEYPVVVGMLIYAMALFGRLIPLSANMDLLTNYYYYTAIFLAIPTFLTIRELFRLGELLGLKSGKRRTLLYFVATPSFVFMVLTNWYIIGVFFALFGLRKFRLGSTWFAGVFFGLSAATNLVTAMPALGMIFTSQNMRQRVKFVLGAVITVGVIYAPFLALNPSFITRFFDYQANWYVEGSWMLVLFPSDNPLRHVLFPLAFILLSGAILYKGFKVKMKVTKIEDWRSLTVMMAGMFSFAWLFSSYISTPQTNLMLLPYFTLLPIAFYPEFLVFDTANSLIDVWGFSQPLIIFGILLHPADFGSPEQSPIQALEVIRSVWIGKFLIYDGLLRSKFLSGKIAPQLENRVVSSS